jgi:hypothetical protein
VRDVTIDVESTGCGGELLEDWCLLPRRRLRAKSSFSSHISSTFITCSLNFGSSLPVSATGKSFDAFAACVEVTWGLIHLLDR